MMEMWFRFNKKHTYSLGLFLAISALSWAQSPDEELFLFQQNYPNENAILEFSKEFVDFSVVEGQLKAKLRSEEQIFLITDKASYYAKDEVWHSELFQLQELEAYSLVPNTKKYQIKKVSKFEEKDNIGGVNFYDDNKLKLFEYPDLIKGSKKYLNYAYDILEPALIGSFRFSQAYDTELAELVITADKDIEIGYVLFNTDSFNINFKEEVGKNGKKTYTWTCKDLDKIESESGAPNIKYFTPHILYYVKSYQHNGEQVELLNGVSGLHSYYLHFLDSVNTVESPALKSLVEEIIDPEADELTKVKTVYQWVQDNIRYVAFEAGYGGFIPRQANHIYKKRFGDCKDMASIIHEMLKYAGIESHWTWIGSRALPYKYSEVATPSVDNHMINTYIHGDKYYFLDGTSSETPFGIPTSFIQGKEALIHINEDSFVVAEVPIIPAEVNQVVDTTYLKVEDNVLKGKANVAYYAYHRNKIVNYFGDADGDNRKKKVKNYTEKGSNKYNLLSYEELNKKEKDLPYQLNLKFEIPDHLIKVDDKIYINLNLEKSFQDFKLEKDRKVAFELDFKQTFKNLVSLEIPEDYEVDYLPEPYQFDHELFSFETSYRKEGNKVILDHQVKTNFLLLDKKDFTEFNQFVRTINEAYSEAIVLKKRN